MNNKTINELVNKLSNIVTNKKIEKEIIEKLITKLNNYCDGKIDRKELNSAIDILRMKLSKKSILHTELVNVVSVIEANNCRNNKLEKIVKEHIESLSKYCHDKNCDSIYDCPTLHENCKNKLGLDTAIAWKIVSTLRMLLNGYKNIADTKEIVDYCIDILKFHRENYCSLLNILYDCSYTLENWIVFKQIDW